MLSLSTPKILAILSCAGAAHAAAASCKSIVCMKSLVFNVGQEKPGDVETLGPRMWLNLRPTPLASDSAFVKSLFMPTIWSKDYIDSAANWINSQPVKPPAVQIFNEPNFQYAPGDTNLLTPQQAADIWRSQIIPKFANKGYPLISPSSIDAGVPGGRINWLKAFKAACPECWNSVHAINLHDYDGNFDHLPPYAKLLHESLDNKPIWITEIAAGGQNMQYNIDFMHKVYNWALATPYIEQVFWNTARPIPGDPNVGGSNLFTNQANSILTDIGREYVNLGKWGAPAPPPPPPPGPTVAPWGQCGGIGYTGPKTCTSGWTCKVSNPWYSQCLQ